MPRMSAEAERLAGLITASARLAALKPRAAPAQARVTLAPD